jgi:hypothetical protein
MAMSLSHWESVISRLRSWLPTKPDVPVKRTHRSSADVFGLSLPEHFPGCFFDVFAILPSRRIFDSQEVSLPFLARDVKAGRRTGVSTASTAVARDLNLHKKL